MKTRLILDSITLDAFRRCNAESEFWVLCEEEDRRNEYFAKLGKEWRATKQDLNNLYDFELLERLKQKLLFCHSNEEKNIRFEIKKCKYLLGFSDEKPRISKEEVKEKPINRVLEALNIHNEHGFILCPSHNEDTPSCKIYEDTNSAYCFGCGAYFDNISLIQKALNYDFKMALEWAEGI